MVERILNFFQRESSSLHEAAFLLGSLALVSQILALIRDRLLAASFGAGLELDTYYAAFRVPDLLYVSLASFMSVTVVLPFFTKHLERGDRASAEHLMNDLFRIFLGLMLTAIVILYWFMPQILAWVAPGFDPAHQLELLKLSRILLLSPLLLGLSNLVATVTQSSRKFLLYALSPVLYNLGIIAGIIFLYPVLGLAGLTWGVVIGAFAHLAIQWPAFRRGPVSFRLRRRAPITNRAEWRTVLLLSLPRTLTLSAHQLSIVVLVALASYLAAGSIAVFNFAYNLQAVLLSIIGVSYSVATFPALVRLFTNGNQKQFVEHLGTAARHIVFWSLPTLTLFIVLRAQIVRVILGAGKFDWADTRLTAAATAIFLVSVAAQSLILLFVRG
ncbi:MAG: lipid II flippase MurJ, partial [Patescibacteria group bacterium]